MIFVLIGFQFISFSSCYVISSKSTTNGFNMVAVKNQKTVKHFTFYLLLWMYHVRAQDTQDSTEDINRNHTASMGQIHV